MSELISASEASRNARRCRRILEDMFPFLRQSGVLAKDQAPEAAGEKVEALIMKIEAALTAANVDERTRFAVKHLVDELVDHVGDQQDSGETDGAEDDAAASFKSFLESRGMKPEDVTHALSLAGLGAGGDEGEAHIIERRTERGGAGDQPAGPPDLPGGARPTPGTAQPLSGGKQTPLRPPPDMRGSPPGAQDAALAAMANCSRIGLMLYGEQPLPSGGRSLAMDAAQRGQSRKTALQHAGRIRVLDDVGIVR